MTTTIEKKIRGFGSIERYTLEQGEVFLSGVQALVRMTFDQIRADRRAGLRTALFVSGYRGSPLGILDQTFARAGRLLTEHDVVFNNGLNEDVAATAVWGTQMLEAIPGAKYDGVLGMWYGKGPGVDRSGDALKHANYTGVGKNGGVLALAGDDPGCKSSSLPQQSEAMLWHLQIPTLYPGSIQDVLDFGLHGYALSRASGLWAGMKIVTDVADGAGLASVSPDRVRPVVPTVELDGEPFTPKLDMGINVQPRALEMERTLYEARLELARRYARANRLDRIVSGRGDAWLGILTAGKTYHDVRQTLREMGLGDDELDALGIRILKLGMILPLEPEVLREFADGLEEIFVVEEKRPFLETFAKDVLYGRANAPRIVGKRDEEGRPLLPYHGELAADLLAGPLAARLSRRIPNERLSGRNERILEIRSLVEAPAMGRTPYFCSGCPHNRSTNVPEGSVVAAGIGCHTMAMWMDRGITMGTHMGGEGAQWVGMAPFTDVKHIFQNVGDGTYFHSGRVALEYAVASGVTMTYKLLYNAAVAMTGGQDAMGTLPVPDVTRELEAVGVTRTIVMTDEPEKYGRARFAPKTEVWHRDRLDEAQKLLAETPGVTVLLYDQQCAAEKRRMRGKGELVDPPTRVFINERVCEGCADCQKKSNCLSVEPVETEFGRKTRIHQPSCNKDYSCLLGDCPSFLTITPAGGTERKKERRLPPLEREIPEPATRVSAEEWNARIMGIGGTGVVTVGAVLAAAASNDGLYVTALDQTGLAQKGGQVVTDLKIGTQPLESSNRLAAGTADLYLVFDLLAGTNPANLDRCDPERTTAVVSTSRVPTGLMILDPRKRFPEKDGLLESVARVSRREAAVHVDGQSIAEGLFADSIAANLLMLGVAYQSGLVPLSAEAIEQAIRDSRVAVEMSLLAFAWGRMTIADPDLVRAQIASTTEKPMAHRALTPVERSLVDSVAPSAGELRRLLEIRIPDLVAYESERYARRYAKFVRAVVEAESTRTPGRTALAEAVARHLYKLMAYKDEYEVARLQLEMLESGELTRRFGEGVEFEWHLHPPMLRALGLKKKLRFGPWFERGFRVLARMRRIRGTPLDPFAWAKVRRTERRLVREYRKEIRQTLAHLSPESHAAAVALASLPDEIRGYEDVKLESVVTYRSKLAAMRDEVRQPQTAAA